MEADVLNRLMFVEPSSDRTCSIPRMRVGLRCPKNGAPVLVDRCMLEVLGEVNGIGVVTCSTCRAGCAVSSLDGNGKFEDEELDCLVSSMSSGVWI